MTISQRGIQWLHFTKRKSRPTDSTSQSHTDIFGVGINAPGVSALSINDEFVQSHNGSRLRRCKRPLHMTRATFYYMYYVSALVDKSSIVRVIDTFVFTITIAKLKCRGIMAAAIIITTQRDNTIADG
ncbi:hypothetical protein D9C73_012670 [Collichthys lucidus]|uniref:Uncharacterized protein n=1 Tax=Collichthys lucidus TaxID=240159 RepID=A0A4U5UTK0_COLLU|nr:hypothetical protein D9C73_012670 [Collichthys lucidus]